jgi:CubicO group peptidase (beta-lactamase class C family)
MEVVHETEVSIEGTCTPNFEEVRSEFARNFQERGEVGAAVCIYHHGEKVVDLWGGHISLKKQDRWQQDTIVQIWSVTKAMTSTCAHILIDRGLLDLDTKVTAYWPEFGVNGKADTTIRMLMDHTAGIPALREPLPEGAFFDWDLMVHRIADATPFWRPGTTQSYHGLLFGWIVGEVIRRVSGISLGEFFRLEVGDKLDADVWIGLPESEEYRVAHVLMPEPQPDDHLYEWSRMVQDEPESAGAYYMTNSGGYFDRLHDRQARAAQLGAFHGMASAQGVAKVFNALADPKCEALVRRTAVGNMYRITSASHIDQTLRGPIRFAAGFMGGVDNRATLPGGRYDMIMGRDAFGHPGYGGSIGFGDPSEGLAMGYVMNKMQSVILVGTTGQALMDAAYRSLGFNRIECGHWVR